MKIIIIFLFFLLAYPLSGANAQEQISTGEAKDNIGQTLQVKGKVANIFISQKGTTFINFDDKSPNQTFTAVIMNDVNINISGIIEGCILTVYGEIKEYKGKPEIILENQEQIISIE